jgi:uncharacterized membrane protein
MHRHFRFLRTTLAGGILFLVPVIVLFIIVEKALKVARQIVSPLAAHLPIQSVLGLETPKVLAIALLVLVCFLAGLVARARAAKRMVSWLETSFLTNLPGYEFLKGMGEGLLGAETQQTYEVVLARIEDAWQLAFLIERLEKGHLAVFVPGAPNPRSGSVYFLTNDRIKPINLSTQAAMKCLKRLGAGSNALLQDLPKPSDKPSAQQKTTS